MTIVQALLIALFVAAIESRALGYATLTMRFSPLMAGFWVGLILGDMHQAMVVTATIQLIYMGVVAPGGAMPSEPAVASAIAVSVAVIGDLDAEAAVAIAVPVGLMGSYLYQLRFFLNTIAVNKMDQCAVRADSRGLAIWIAVVPTIFSFLLFVPTITIALYLGAPVISDVMNAISNGPVLHALDVVSGGLAALGIAITMHVIGSRKLLVFFFLAYFLVVITTQAGLSITMITWAIFGVIIAFCYNMFTAKAEA
ncbi:PTS sugar transporter subunit IIC [Collinsella tanakaei]|nr:PTS sugar transporter subunit IIC [Collinsella tanakaei]